MVVSRKIKIVNAYYHAEGVETLMLLVCKSICEARVGFFTWKLTCQVFVWVWSGC